MWLRVVVCIRPSEYTVPYDYNTVRKEYDPLKTLPKILIRR